MTKRRKFILAAAILAGGLLATQYVAVEVRYLGIGVFSLLSYFVSLWALYDDLKRIEWLTIVPLPALYAASVALFYFLLPEKALSRVAILGLFGLGMYALYLTGNIFSVAAVRTIQLLRAAQAVGFLLSLLTAALFCNTIFSLKLPFWVNGTMVFVVSLALVLPALWSVKLSERLEPEVIWASVSLSLVYLMMAVAVSFLPITVWVASLFLVTGIYVGVGIMQLKLAERLFERTLYEYVGVGVLVLVATLMVTQWK
jgi:hypothetical protein